MSEFYSSVTELSAAPPAAPSAESPPVSGVERTQSVEALRVPRRLASALRWGACLTLAFGLHAAGAAALFARWHAQPDDVAGAPLILVELAPVTAAPAAVPTEIAPGPPQPQAEEQPQPAPDKPVEKAAMKPAAAEPLETAVALPPPPAAELSLPAQPPPKAPDKKVEKAEKKKPQKHASLASAPTATEQRAERAAAPAPGALSRSDALPNWKSALVAQLERNKRYPPEAQPRGDHGVAQLAFSVDRNGGVHGARIVRSSGSALLDRAAVELVERAAPMPPPPPEVAGAQIAIVVPIRYNSR